MIDMVSATRKASDDNLDIDQFVQIGGFQRGTIARARAANGRHFYRTDRYITPRMSKQYDLMACAPE
jgi:hypothetical protein